LGRSLRGQNTHRQGLSWEINSFLFIYFIKMKTTSTLHISKILLLILKLLPVMLLFYSELCSLSSLRLNESCVCWIYTYIWTQVEQYNGILIQTESVTKNPGVQKIWPTPCYKNPSDEKSGGANNPRDKNSVNPALVIKPGIAITGFDLCSGGLSWKSSHWRGWIMLSAPRVEQDI
jgi:hypothetical protein